MKKVTHFTLQCVHSFYCHWADRFQLEFSSQFLFNRCKHSDLHEFQCRHTLPVQGENISLMYFRIVQYITSCMSEFHQARAQRMHTCTKPFYTKAPPAYGTVMMGRHLELHLYISTDPEQNYKVVLWVFCLNQLLVHFLLQHSKAEDLLRHEECTHLHTCRGILHMGCRTTSIHSPLPNTYDKLRHPATLCEFAITIY